MNLSTPRRVYMKIKKKYPSRPASKNMYLRNVTEISLWTKTSILRNIINIYDDYRRSLRIVNERCIIFFMRVIV